MTVEFLTDNAILYYVSCCLLLLGTYSLMRSPWLSGGLLTRYCETYGIFLAYVILLTGLCFLVYRRLSLFEDGLVMAGMTLLLVLDPTFFNNVFYTYKLSVGVEVNSFCLILSMSLYSVLRKTGGIPWTKRFTAVATLAAGFVYLYPIGLNTGWAERATQSYFYALWWIPLAVAVLCESVIRTQPASEQVGGAQTHETDERASRSGSASPSVRTKQRFRVASMLIVFYIVLSHLIEANYAYSLEFHAEYLSPLFLAAGLLFFKLRPGFGKGGRQYLWTCSALAACCSCAPTASSTVHLPWGVTLSSFHYGLSAVALFLLYFWQEFGKRSWASAAAVCLLLAVSGPSLPGSIYNICHFQFVPFFYLGLVFAAWSLFEGAPFFSTLAGGCLIVSLLSLIPVPEHHKFVIFLQAAAAWIALVQWHFYDYARRKIYSLAGAFIFSLAATMVCISTHRVAWGVDYLIVVMGLLFAARFLKSIFLWALFLMGTLSLPAYFSRHQFVSAAAEFLRVVNFGLLLMILAFLLLPLAYFLSARKTRRAHQIAR